MARIEAAKIVLMKSDPFGGAYAEKGLLGNHTTTAGHSGKGGRVDSPSQVEHEASISKIGEDQLFYCRQRGISPELPTHPPQP